MSKNISKKSSSKITSLNFIGCILIILLHSTRYKYFEVTHACAVIIDAIALYLPEMGVPLFFTLSGFLMFKDVEIGTDNVRPIYIEKIKKRISSLLIPYFVFNIWWMLITILEQSIPFINSHINSAIRFNYSLSDVLGGIFFFKFNGVAWYLFCLMIYSLLFPLFFLAEKKKLGGVLLVVIFILSCLRFPDGWLIGYLTHYNSIFFYTLGVTAAFWKHDVVNKDFSFRQRLLSIIVLCMVVWGLSIVPHDNVLQYNIILTLLRTLGVACIWCGLDCIKKFNLPWFFRITFFIYLMHSEIQKCINKLLEIVLPNQGNIYAIINITVGMLGTYIIIVIVAYILMRFFPRIWQILNGGRLLKLR